MGIIGRRKMATSLKVLICGDGAIGKTCLLDTICEKGGIDWDAPEYKPTAADNLQKDWSDADGKEWEISLWDTAGQEALGNLRKNAYPGTEVLLIGFDMTKGVSLENIPSWVDEVTECEENIGATILVGTKSDYYEELKEGGKGSDQQPLKTMEEMYAMAVQVGAHAFVCTSALNGYGLLEDADEGPAVGCEPDTLSGQGENNYLDIQIMRCGGAVKDGLCIPALESRAPAPAPAPAPVKGKEAVPEPPKPAPPKPAEPKPAEPKTPEPAKQAPAKPAAKKEEGGCCTLL